jgi:hypothetical protein
LDDLLEPVLDDLLVASLALDALTVSLPVVTDVYGSRVPVAFLVDGGFVLADQVF